MRAAAAAALAAALLTGCLYREPPVAPPWMQTAAMAHCAATGQAVPTRPFRTDGCTLWPDRAWLSCCVTHDMEYWCGGRPQMRARSDRKFAMCLAMRGCGGVAGVTAWLGVRIGGVPWLPTPWRWGYGRGP